jgi:hypothetical protein
MTVAMRLRRLVLLACVAYVAVDLGCPLVPGAFSFDPDESVDAVSAYRIRPPAVPRAAVSLPMAVTPMLAPAAAHGPSVSAVPSLAGWRPHADHGRSLVADPRPTAEDD